MHRTLHIDEFIRSVVGLLKTTDHYHLALAHRVFLEPALDALWETLDDGLERSLKLWPENATENFSSVLLADRYAVFVVPWSARTLIRPLTPNEWDRFIYYSRRIRAFSMTHTIERFPPLFLRHLAESLNQPGAPATLLPNVRLIKLDMRFKNGHIPQFFSYFLSSTLRELYLNDSSDAGDGLFHHLLESLIALGSPLSTFTLRNPVSMQSSDICLNLIGACSHSLTSITLQHAPWSVIEVLGTLPRLQYVDLGQCKSPPADVVLPSSSFPALRRIHAEKNLLLAILPTLATKTFITEISIFNYDLPSQHQPDAFQHLIDIIGSSCPMLQAFRYRSSVGWNPFDQIHHSFSALKNCNEMRCFEIASSVIEVPPTDDEYVEFGRAWPELRTLCFATPSNTCTTLETFKALHSSCPHLEHVSIATNFDPEGCRSPSLTDSG